MKLNLILIEKTKTCFRVFEKPPSEDYNIFNFKYPLDIFQDVLLLYLELLLKNIKPIKSS